MRLNNPVKTDEQMNIFTLEIGDSPMTKVATYGDIEGNNSLAVFMDELNVIQGMILVNVKNAYEGESDLRLDKSFYKGIIAPFINLKRDSLGKLIILDNFELYIGEDNIVFIFGSSAELYKNEIQVDRLYEEEKVKYGYDEEYNLKYLKINNITRGEHDQLIAKLKSKGIPIEKRLNHVF